MSRFPNRAVSRSHSIAALLSLAIGLAACVTDPSTRSPAGGGFGIGTAALTGAQPLDRISEVQAAAPRTDISASGRGASAPLQVAGAAGMASGVGSFQGFRSTFLSAVEDGRAADYMDRVFFPLTTIDYRSPDGNGRSISAGSFTPHLIYDAQTLQGREIEPIPLGDTFTGGGSEALYWGDRLLVFRPVDGSWMLTEAGSCDDRSCRPADLLCRGLDNRRPFPGRGPSGHEDFHAFYRAFYCLSAAALDPENAEVPADATIEVIAPRIRFPLGGVRSVVDSEEIEEFEVVLEDFQPGLLFPSMRAVPSIRVDGVGATAHVGVEADDRITALFSRIEGLWYLTGLAGLPPAT